MPPIRRRGPVRRGDLVELSKDQRYHLETGMYWFEGFGGDLDAFKVAWGLHRETILAEFIQKHPGSRPFAWWLLDHKKERPLAQDVPADMVDAYRTDTHHGDTFGFLHTRTLGRSPLTGEWGEMQEPEAMYLDRHGLLTAAERQALAAPA